MDNDKIYKFALVAEKIVPKTNALPAAAAVQASAFHTLKYFYCEQTGHYIKFKALTMKCGYHPNRHQITQTRALLFRMALIS